MHNGSYAMQRHRLFDLQTSGQGSSSSSRQGSPASGFLTPMSSSFDFGPSQSPDHSMFTRNLHSDTMHGRSLATGSHPQRSNVHEHDDLLHMILSQQDTIYQQLGFLTNTVTDLQTTQKDILRLLHERPNVISPVEGQSGPPNSLAAGEGYVPVVLDRTDFPDIDCWTLNEYYKHVETTKGISGDDDDKGDHKTLWFITDRQGRRLSCQRYDAMRKYSKAIWVFLFGIGEAPDGNWSTASQPVVSYYAKMMTQRFEELTWCDEDYKCHRLAYIDYNSWYGRFTGKRPTKTGHKRSQGDDGPAAKKRRRIVAQTPDAAGPDASHLPCPRAAAAASSAPSGPTPSAAQPAGPPTTATGLSGTAGASGSSRAAPNPGPPTIMTSSCAAAASNAAGLVAAQPPGPPATAARALTTFGTPIPDLEDEGWSGPPFEFLAAPNPSTFATAAGGTGMVDTAGPTAAQPVGAPTMAGTSIGAARTVSAPDISAARPLAPHTTAPTSPGAARAFDTAGPSTAEPLGARTTAGTSTGAAPTVSAADSNAVPSSAPHAMAPTASNRAAPAFDSAAPSTAQPTADPGAARPTSPPSTIATSTGIGLGNEATGPNAARPSASPTTAPTPSGAVPAFDAAGPSPAQASGAPKTAGTSSGTALTFGAGAADPRAARLLALPSTVATSRAATLGSETTDPDAAQPLRPGEPASDTAGRLPGAPATVMAPSGATPMSISSAASSAASLRIAIRPLGLDITTSTAADTFNAAAKQKVPKGLQPKTPPAKDHACRRPKATTRTIDSIVKNAFMDKCQSDGARAMQFKFVHYWNAVIADPLVLQPFLDQLNGNGAAASTSATIREPGRDVAASTTAPSTA